MSLLEYSEQILFLFVSVIYGSAFLVASFQLISKGAYPQKWIYYCLILGFLAQTIALNIRAIFVESCPLGNAFEITQFLTWSLVLLYFVIKPIFKIDLLGYFTALIASFSTSLVLIFPGLDEAYSLAKSEPLESLIEVHASLAIFSYALFALLAILSAMFLIQQYGLKNQLFKGLFRYLPSIQRLNSLSTKLLWIGVFILFVSLIFGTIFWIEEPERVPVLKFIASVVLFTAYALLGLLKWRNWISPNKQAILAIILIVSALLILGTMDASPPDSEAVIQTTILP
jgi:HemX protein